MISIYIHVPFCKQRCLYCDFSTYAGLEYLIPDYINAVCEELKHASSLMGDQDVVHTIFFGGGTPSLLEPDQVEAVLNEISKNYRLTNLPEISMEANPGTIHKTQLIHYRNMGINRLSIGAQSFRERDLHHLNRIHASAEIFQAVEDAHAAGFENLNLDLLFGIMGQSLADWLVNIEKAISLNPTHLSMYSLIVEEDTPLIKLVDSGAIILPDDDETADMYQAARSVMKTAGYEHYEISNWAKEGSKCQHNLQYWHNQPYLGIGAAAHGFIKGLRYANIAHPQSYIAKIKQYRSLSAKQTVGIFSASELEEKIDKNREMQETMLMGLRLVAEGVCAESFKNRFGVSLQSHYAEQIQPMVARGLLEWMDFDGKLHLRLSAEGVALGNIVFREFV